MKKRLLIVIAIIVLLLFLRETGIVKIFAAITDSQFSTVIDPGGLKDMYVTAVRYEPDSGEIYMPKVDIIDIDNSYRCTVRYRVVTSLSLWRWVPLFKFGKNQAQLTYIVWAGPYIRGCGIISRDGSLSIRGLASARDYRNAITEDLIAEMKKSVESKLHIFTRKSPINAWNQPSSAGTQEGGSR